MRDNDLILDRIKNLATRPRSRFSRWFDGTALLLCGVAIVIAAALLKYYGAAASVPLEQTSALTRLVLNLWLMLLLAGAIASILGIYSVKLDTLPRVFAGALTVFVGIATVLVCFVAVHALVEIQ